MLRSLLVVLLTLCSACWSELGTPRAASISVLGLEPRERVPVDAPLQLLLEAPIAVPEGRWPITITRADGRAVLADARLDPDGLRIHLDPVPEWPADETLQVLVGDGLRGRSGESVVFDEGSGLGTFTTAALTLVSGFAVEGPEPGSAIPTNVRRLVLTLSGAGPAVEHVRLVSDHHSVDLEVVDRDERGRLVAEVHAGLVGLRPTTTYRLEVEPHLDPIDDVRGVVRTGTVSDATPPDLRLRQLDRGGATVRAVIEADEPVFARGWATGPDGVAVELRGALLPGIRVDLMATEPLRPETAYALRLEATDYAGLSATPVEVGFVTPPEIRVQLSEVVTTPLHDWGDALTGVPFDAVPGRGAVTDADEWIELINVSRTPIDLTQVALRLRVVDGSPSEHDVVAAAHLHFGRGGEPRAWGVGEALVVRPRGSMAQRDLLVEVLWGDQILDAAALGRGPLDDHGGGPPPDLEHESITRRDGVWRWCRPTPGDPQPGACLR